MIEAGENIEEPVMDIKHSELKRFSDSPYKSECPKCKKGLLLVGRDPMTLILQKSDYCVLCGQRFIYTDIDSLRRKDGISV